MTTPAESVKSTAKPAAAANAGQRVVNSDTLLQGQSHVSIAHNGETYQLRATRLGKLILTK
ncbi:hemin uptake protein HemP [Burkholderia oklahomensis]|uniref:hemin uptake protein HemP n=1 Tax=Burkholderia oklahomensis TaxID=342113 RepID=UPI00030B751D